MAPRTDDPSTLAQVGVSGKQTVIWSFSCRMLSTGCPWDPLLWEGQGGSRTGPRQKGHSPFKASSDPTGNPGAILAHPTCPILG